MSAETSRRIAAAAARVDAGWALLSGADSVCYASGHVVPIETGVSPFSGGPSLALVGPDGAVRLVVSNLEAASAEASSADQVFSHVGFSAAEPEPYVDHFTAAVAAAFDAALVSGRIAVEPQTLPWTVAEQLRRRGVEIVDGTTEFARARMVKTDEELTCLRESARMAAIAQRTAVDFARPGMTELELFALIRLAVETAAGERVAFAGDLLTGIPRTSGVAGWATTRRIEPGDIVLADLAPRIGGYWSDSCNTFVLGTATSGLARLHELAARALQAGIRVAAPGVPAGVVDHAVRSVIADAGYEYGHHTGHGIGTSVHEFPRIIPGESAPLEEGMVILLEPGVYDPDIGGVRLEWMFEVRPEGLVRLTDFDHGLQAG
ncbi:M24 family metallopeptidase [uncultured Microbacterium sp.]|uniref:M24 family metallopeptidase n=1 Tax=uncultured Microbacterium sp. TaxID=191216 RepID=UPI0035CA12B9